MSRLAALAVALTAIAAAGSAHAAPGVAPTSVTLVSGGDGDARVAGLVAVQRISSGTVRIVGSAVAADGAPVSLLLAAGSCAALRDPARVRGGIELPSAAYVDARRAVPAAALRRVVVAIVRDGAVAACRPTGVTSRASAIVSPRDSASGQATGIVVLRRLGSVIRVDAFASQTQPFADGLVLEFMARPCDAEGAPLATLRLTGPGGTATLPSQKAAVAKPTQSIVLKAGSTTGCAKWEPSELDAAKR